MLLKMTYNDLISDISDKGIFEYLNEIKPMPFEEIVTPAEMDLAFSFTNGNMLLSQSTTNMFLKYGSDQTLQRTASVIYTLFGDRWGKLYNAFIDELPLNVSERETLKENNTLSGSVDHNVSAYDSEELVKDNQDKTDNTTDHNYTKDKISLNALQNNIKLLQDNYIYAIMFNDIKSILFSLLQ